MRQRGLEPLPETRSPGAMIAEAIMPADRELEEAETLTETLARDRGILVDAEA